MKILAFLALLVSGAVHAQTALPLPAGYPNLLGVSCGGVHVASYVTGFDSLGHITGEVYAWTRCGGSGRGGGYKSHTYQSWTSIAWDLNLNYKLLPYDQVFPDPAFTAADQYGNTILNVCAGTTNGQPACIANANIYYVPPTTTPVSVKVPSLSGKTAVQAATAVQTAGLVEVSYTQASNTIPANYVCGQSPVPGTVVDPGTKINVCISLGPADD